MTLAEKSQRFADVRVGDSLPERDFDCDNVQLILFLATAALNITAFFNALPK